MFILTDHSSPGLGLASKECQRQGLLPFRNFIRYNKPPLPSILKLFLEKRLKINIEINI